ncbi:MAG: polysaccharide biosynthesis tyrosine autokinase [Sedimentisphaerales bacterium]|nr:polysaccharide biosynthesis tyrosine autokinase [Sedimentisphaerales bacterium]
MNNLEKYLDQVIEQKPVVYETPAEPEEEAQPNILKGVLRRWYIVLFVFIAVCGVGLPAIWLLIEPRHVVTGAIHVAPFLSSVLTGEPDQGEISDYDTYMNTQAMKMTSGPILQDVADDLVPLGLSFFERQDPSDWMGRLRRKLQPRQTARDPVEILRDAISNGIISAGPIRRTEYIGVTMKHTNESEAKDIVNSFLRKFDASYGRRAQTVTDSTLAQLDDQEKELRKKIQRQQDEIRNIAQSQGTTDFDSQQEMAMQRQTALATELTRLEAQRIRLEARVAVLEQGGDSNLPQDVLTAARKQYVSADSMVEELVKNIVEMKRNLIVAEQNMTPGNPELDRRQKLLANFEAALQQKELELGQEFDEQMDVRSREANKQRLAAAKAELAQIQANWEQLNRVLKEQVVATKEVGIAGADYGKLNFDMRIDQELYDTVLRRKRSIEMELDRQARITLASEAATTGVEDKRIKYSAALAFLGLGCGVGLAFLRDKVDKTLQTPDDVSRHIDLPIIGTTTSSHTIKPAQFAEQIAGDYQTIRANLGLLTDGRMPKKLAISSAGMREGKTTFAVNLATSLAKSGKKVLLIDGDLRKPDVGHMLSISNASAGVQEVLSGEDPVGVIRAVPSSGLHVLTANPRNLADTYELLSSTSATEQIEKLGHDYDHVIIDTPPALAFPDALVWAKLTDAVILVGFAGQTTAPDLKEARERFGRIRARVLGAVLSNVSIDQNPYAYGYGYNYRAQGGKRARKRRAARKLLLASQNRESELSDKKV